MNPLAKITLAILKHGMNEEQRERFSQIMWEKHNYALTTFALAKMGAETKKYYESAWELFLTNLAVSDALGALESDTLFPLIEATPFIIPKSTKNSIKIPFNEDDPSEVEAEYERVKKVVTEVRKKTRSRGALNLALMEQLPGYPKDLIREAGFNRSKPSKIALKYVAWKYKFPFSDESLKKRFALMKNSHRLSKSINDDLFKSLKSALLKGR